MSRTPDVDGPVPEDLVVDELPLVTYRDSIDVTGTASNSRTVRVRVGSGPETVAEVETPDSPTPSPFRTRVRLSPGMNLLLAQAADSAGNLSTPPESLRVVRRSGAGKRPVLLRTAVADSLPDGKPAPVRRGDTIRITTWWTVPDTTASIADSLEVAADFSSLDGDLPGITQVMRLAGQTGAYMIHHYMADGIGRPDGPDVRVPITAMGPTGFTNDTSLRICLSNRPPLHLETMILDPKPAPYRMGDSVRIVTRWHSEDGLPLSIRADLSNILVDPGAVTPRVTQSGDSTFILRFRIPLSGDNLHEDGARKWIPLTCRDSGCGVTVDRSLAIDLDTQPPPSEGLFLNPLPEVTERDSILVSGEAPDAAFAYILRDRTVRAEVVPDPDTWRFEAKISLAMGRNVIQARSGDEAGNSTPLTMPPMVVYRVEGAVLSIPAPYSRKNVPADTEDDIVVRDPVGIRDVRIRIFTLEGDCVAESAGENPGLRYAWHWDGQAADGRRASQGYYIVRAEWTDVNGSRKQAVKGLLLKD